MEASDRMPCQGIPATKRPNLFSLMAEDVQVAVERDPAAANAFIVLTSYPGIHAIWAHRVEHWLWKHGFKWFARAGSQLTRFFTGIRSEEHTSELQSPENLVCRLLLEKKKKIQQQTHH